MQAIKGARIKEPADLTIVMTCKNYYQMEDANNVLHGPDQLGKLIEFANMITAPLIKFKHDRARVKHVRLDILQS